MSSFHSESSFKYDCTRVALRNLYFSDVIKNVLDAFCHCLQEFALLWAVELFQNLIGRSWTAMHVRGNGRRFNMQLTNVTLNHSKEVFLCCFHVGFGSHVMNSPNQMQETSTNVVTI